MFFELMAEMVASDEFPKVRREIGQNARGFLKTYILFTFGRMTECYAASIMRMRGNVWSRPCKPRETHITTP